MAALETRAEVVAQGDYYLCPLTALQVPTAELDRLLEPVFAGQRKPLEIYAPPEGEEVKPTPEDRIALGFEQRVQVSGKDQQGTLRHWEERRLIVRSLSLAKSQEKSLRERIDRAQSEIAALNERKQGKPVLTSVEPAQTAALRIAEAHRVSDCLLIEVHHEVEERTKRRYGARPATTVREERITAQTAIDEPAVEQTIRRFGWRVYATNQGAKELPIEKAV